MSRKQFTVIIERDPDGMLIGTVPSLKGCHTQAKTLPTLMTRVKEAIELCCEVCRDQYANRKLVRIQKVEVAV